MFRVGAASSSISNPIMRWAELLISQLSKKREPLSTKTMDNFSSFSLFLFQQFLLGNFVLNLVHPSEYKIPLLPWYRLQSPQCWEMHCAVKGRGRDAQKFFCMVASIYDVRIPHKRGRVDQGMKQMCGPTVPSDYVRLNSGNEIIRYTVWEMTL